MTALSRLESSSAIWTNRLSSGSKMLIVMALALMPLGLIALFASIQSAHNKELQHDEEARIAAAAEARHAELILLRVANIVRPAAAGASVDPSRCRPVLAEARRVLQADIEISLYSRRGQPLCASSARKMLLRPSDDARSALRVALVASPAVIRIAVAAADGSFAVADIPAAMVASLIANADARQGVALAQQSVLLPLVAPERARAFDRLIAVHVPIAGGQAIVIATSISNRISAIEILLVIMPLLMWAGAALIGWVVVNELLLRPLAHLQRAVTLAGQGGGFELPRITSPAREIRSLGEALARSASEIARRETALGEAFQRQVKLTREVHHRVKNNLQVVASLINLHARGTSGDVAGAYASIQRRVDALAIVHRNHFAELEENRGVVLRALIAELTANLRATAAPGAGDVTITLDMIAAHISQDVAVPIAFLVTEIVELVMACAPRTHLDVTLAPAASADRAILSIHAPDLALSQCVTHPSRERFDRIVTGLARQLRAPLEIGPVTGAYSISIPVLDRD